MIQTCDQKVDKWWITEYIFLNCCFYVSALTLVNVSILILSLTSPDESSVIYEVGFVMVQRWIDPRLRFEIPKQVRHPPQSVYLNGLRHENRIWRPDTYFIKHGEFKQSSDEFDPLHIALKIFPNGTVHYISRRNMIISCEGNLRIFPFDSPKCFFGIQAGKVIALE